MSAPGTSVNDDSGLLSALLHEQRIANQAFTAQLSTLAAAITQVQQHVFQPRDRSPPPLIRSNHRVLSYVTQPPPPIDGAYDIYSGLITSPVVGRRVRLAMGLLAKS